MRPLSPDWPTHTCNRECALPSFIRGFGAKQPSGKRPSPAHEPRCDGASLPVATMQAAQPMGWAPASASQAPARQPASAQSETPPTGKLNYFRGLSLLNERIAESMEKRCAAGGGRVGRGAVAAPSLGNDCVLVCASGI